MSEADLVYGIFGCCLCIKDCIDCCTNTSEKDENKYKKDEKKEDYDYKYMKDDKDNKIDI